MSAGAALMAAHSAGVRLAIDGDSLVLEADTAPPMSVLDGLRRYKAGVMVMLRRGPDGWSAGDWIVFFEERAAIAAAIAEFDGGLSRQQAEACAFECCIAEWLNRNPVRSSLGHCVQCGQPGHVNDQLLPYGTGRSGHAWAHSGCWPVWYQARKEEAKVALAELGIDQRAQRGAAAKDTSG
jgi:hypothetical protein